MKLVIVFLALFCPIAAAAQTPNQPMSEKPATSKESF
jgi:hypothetical protein